ncbi:MAG: hypothetical protein ACLQM6_07490 [Acidobacteriaceae bacterium]
MTDAAELTETTIKRYLCLHTHLSGRRCGSPALRGEQFCYYHHPRRHTAPLADRRAIQSTLKRLLPAILDGSISPERSILLLKLLSLASSNLERSAPVPTRGL